MYDLIMKLSLGNRSIPILDTSQMSIRTNTQYWNNVFIAETREHQPLS